MSKYKPLHGEALERRRLYQRNYYRAARRGKYALRAMQTLEELLKRGQDNN